MTFKKSSQTNKAGSASDEQTFSPMFERHAAIMLLIEPQTGAILDANRAAVDFYGYSKSKLCGMMINEINTLPPEQVEAERQKALNEERNYFIFSHRLSSGEERIVEVRSSPIAWQEKQALFSIIHDITERKQAEEALKQSEAHYHLLANSMTDTVWLMDLNLKPTYISPSVEKVRGYTLEELQQLPLDQHISPASFQLAMEAFSTEIPKVMADLTYSDVRTMELEYYRKDGTTYWAESKLSIIRDENGNPISIMGQDRDISERKRAEEKIRESEERLKIVIEGSQLGYSDWNMKTGEIQRNERWAGMLGYTLEEIETSYQQWKDLLHPDDRLHAQESLQDHIDGKTSIHRDEYRLRAKDGGYRWILDQGTIAEYDAQGNPARMTATHTDITERKQAEEALRESEERLRLAVSAGRMGTWDRNFLSGQLDWSAECKAMFGLAPEIEMNDERFMQALHPEDRVSTNLTIGEALEKQTDFKTEYRVIWPDGTLHWIAAQGHGYYNVDGQATHMAGITFDITERKQAEEEIRQLNAELEQRVRERTAELDDLYNNAPCGYHSVDANGILVRINDTELNWLGYDREEIIGKVRFPDLLTPPGVEFFMNNFSMFKEYGWITDVKFDMLRKDGSILPALLSATAVRDKEGRFLVSRTTIIDHTQQMLADKATREWQAQLETANKELEAFSYSVSHDLRAPLRGIDGWSQALLEDYRDQLDEQGRQYIDRVRSETQRMGYLIDDMLQLSRLSRAEMIKTQVDLSALAQTIVERLKRDEPQRQVDFNIQAGISAEGDSHLLEAALANLLGNAFKFTAKRADARIEFGQTELQGQHVFFVRDNGAGFDMAYAQKLFGAFQRMHKLSEFPGTGVGLATVQRVIHRHGGRVWAEAEVGRGATFYFTLEPSSPALPPMGKGVESPLPLGREAASRLSESNCSQGKTPI